MPKKQLTTQDTLTLLSRAKGLLKDTNVDLPIPQLMGHYLSRGDLIKGLYALHVYLEAKMNAEQDAKLAIAQANLDAAMSTWEAKNLSNYKARQQLSCFCAPASTHPITFEVESDVVVQ